MLEPRAGVGEADALIEERQRCGGTPSPLSRMPDGQAAVRRGRLDRDPSGRSVRRDAVTHGIFDERLQQKVRHLCVERVRIDVAC